MTDLTHASAFTRAKIVVAQTFPSLFHETRAASAVLET